MNDKAREWRIALWETGKIQHSERDSKMVGGSLAQLYNWITDNHNRINEGWSGG